MTDEVWDRAEPDSPCVKTCLLHPQADICIGCLRSSAEIAAWPNMTREARLAVMARLSDRKSRLAPARRGGSAARRGAAQDT